MRFRNITAALGFAAFVAVSVSSVQPAQADEPAPTTTRQENVTPIAFGESDFSLEGNSVATAKVRTKSGKKIMLNVSVKPIPARKINRCWDVKPGTLIDNEGYWHGVLSVKEDWPVPANDNTVCTKKGHGKQVFKKSCDNRVWGVPGGPKHPPARLPRVKGKVTFADYYKYAVTARAKETANGSASAEVIIYDAQDRVICNSASSLQVKGYAFSLLTVTVRSRSTANAQVQGAGDVLIKAKADENLHINARVEAGLDLEGKVSAFCASYPPPPGENKVPPSVTASASGCVGPEHPTAVVNVVFASSNAGDTSATVTFTGQSSKTASLLNGQGSTTFTVSSAGAYSGMVTVHPSEMSAPYSVAVPPCDTPQAAKPTVLPCQINMVLVNNTITCTIKGTVANGKSATLLSTARNGSTITNNAITTVSGTYSVTITIVAPGEVPPINTEFGIAAGKDRIDFLVNQDDGQSATGSTNQFDIVEPNPDPA